MKVILVCFKNKGKPSNKIEMKQNARKKFMYDNNDSNRQITKK